MHKTFVYGTLKKGFPNHYLLTNLENGRANFLFKANTVNEYTLVIATPDNIPFMLENSKGNIISGEVYEVDNKMLETLDRLENHPVLYERTVIKVIPESSDDLIECDAYLLTKFKEELLLLPKLSSYNIKNAGSYVPPHRRNSHDVLNHVKQPMC